MTAYEVETKQNVYLCNIIEHALRKLATPQWQRTERNIIGSSIYLQRS